MTINDIIFNRRLNGYDKDEVDCYINNLTQAYQTAYDEYNAVCGKYNELLDKYNTLGERRENNKPDAAVITKTMAEAETLAQKIIADAQIETDKIREEACMEKVAARMQAQKLIDDAGKEAFEMQECAREIIRDVQTKAEQINIQANEFTAQFIKQLHKLLPEELKGGTQNDAQDIG